MRKIDSGPAKSFWKLYTVSKDERQITDWLVFYWGWNFDISFELCGYFDNRPRINLDLVFFSLSLILPFRNSWTDECDPPKWGLAINNNTIWIYKGGKGNMKGGNKWWSWDIPFLTKHWYRTSILLKDGAWEHETKGRRKPFYTDKWKQRQKSWEYDYTDYDGEVIPTTIYVEEREWRPKWLGWTGRFARVRRTIDVHFSKECGKGKGGWKGGTIGCGHDMLPGEAPLDCLMRMESKRNEGSELWERLVERDKKIGDILVSGSQKTE